MGLRSAVFHLTALLGCNSQTPSSVHLLEGDTSGESGVVRAVQPSLLSSSRTLFIVTGKEVPCLYKQSPSRSPPSPRPPLVSVLPLDVSVRTTRHVAFSGSCH